MHALSSAHASRTCKERIAHDKQSHARPSSMLTRSLATSTPLVRNTSRTCLRAVRKPMWCPKVTRAAHQQVRRSGNSMHGVRDRWRAMQRWRQHACACGKALRNGGPDENHACGYGRCRLQGCREAAGRGFHEAWEEGGALHRTDRERRAGGGQGLGSPLALRQPCISFHLSRF